MLFLFVLLFVLLAKVSYLFFRNYKHVYSVESLHEYRFQKASHFYEQTCQNMKTFKNNNYVAVKENMCKFPWKDFEILKTQQRLAKKGEKAFKSLNLEVKPLALRCMDMMLWSQINVAVSCCIHEHTH